MQKNVLNTDLTGKVAVVTGAGGAVLFLLNNDAASFITGVTIPIDGGFSAYSGV